jgi:hypothetical protein
LLIFKLILTIPADWFPSAATCFAIFFGISFAFLGLILATAIPGVFRSLRKLLKQSVARVRRSGRTLADLSLLQKRGEEIEGMVFFPDQALDEMEGYEESSDVTSDAA